MKHRLVLLAVATMFAMLVFVGTHFANTPERMLQSVWVPGAPGAWTLETRVVR